MKHTLLFLALAVAFLSCDKDDDDGPPPAAPASFTFSINGGATLSADSKKMEYDNATGRWNINAIKGSSGTAGFYTVTLSPGNSAVGNYTVTNPSLTPGTSYILVSDMNDPGSFSSGTISISVKTNSHISGTFTASGGNHPTITSISGSFTNVPIY